MPVQVKVAPPIEWSPVTKVGSFQVDWEYTQKPRLLRRRINKMREKFVRDMELQGLELCRDPRLKENPTTVCHPDGTPMASYAIDWEGDPPTAEDGGELPKTRATSLEESKGMVEIRLVGVFLAPKLPVEVGTTKERIYAEEKDKKNPVQFGYKPPQGGLVVPQRRLLVPKSALPTS